MDSTGYTKAMKWIAAILGIIVLIGLLRIGELYTQLARYRAYWHRHNQITLSNSRVENIRYYALGDSTAQGVGATSPEKSYPVLVAKEINRRNGRDVELINLSKSGATVADALSEQIPIIKSLGVERDDIVTIEIGANDMKTFDPAKFEREMNELMSNLPKQTVISDVPSFAGSINKKYERNVLEANEIIRRLVDTHGLQRALLYDRVAANHGLSIFAADLFHPSNKGYRENWARAFIEQL